MSEQHDRPTDDGGGREIQSRSGAMVITAMGQTDIGRHRQINQDSLGNLAQNYAARAEELGLLYAIADGMGGHAQGEVASALAIEHLFKSYYAADPQADPRQTLGEVFVATNAAVYEAGRASPGGGNMGTTLTAALFRDNRLYVGNIGDSRTYRIRDGQIEQLSHDHSLVGEQLRSGLLSKEEAQHSNIRNVITRAVGYREQVEADAFALPIAPGDLILLCSDGLHGLVEDDEMARIVSTQPLSEAVPALIELARQRGGPDNITVLVARVDAMDESAAAASQEDTLPLAAVASADAATKPLATLPAPQPAPAPAARALAPPPRRRFLLALAVLLPLVLLGLLGGGVYAWRVRGGSGATPAAGAVQPTAQTASEPTTPASPVVAATTTTLATTATTVPVAAASPQATGGAVGNRASASPVTVTVPTAPAASLPTAGVLPTVEAPTPHPAGIVPMTGRIQLVPPFPDQLDLERGWQVVAIRPQASGAPEQTPFARSKRITRELGAGLSYQYEIDIPRDLADGAYTLELRSTELRGATAGLFFPCSTQTMTVQGGQPILPDLTLNCEPRRRP